MRRIAVLVVLVVACKSDKPATTNPTGSGSAAQPEPAPVSYAVDLAPFDKACATDADCALVYIYPCETRCGCAQHTIAAKDLDKFKAAAAAIKCPPEDVTREQVQCGSCMSPVPACVNGACATRPAP